MCTQPLRRSCERWPRTIGAAPGIGYRVSMSYWFSMVKPVVSPSVGRWRSVAGRCRTPGTAKPLLGRGRRILATARPRRSRAALSPIRALVVSFVLRGETRSERGWYCSTRRPALAPVRQACAHRTRTCSRRTVVGQASPPDLLDEAPPRCESAGPAGGTALADPSSANFPQQLQHTATCAVSYFRILSHANRGKVELMR